MDCAHLQVALGERKSRAIEQEWLALCHEDRSADHLSTDLINDIIIPLYFLIKSEVLCTAESNIF